MTIATSRIVQSSNPECRARAEILADRGRTLFALADGAGGLCGGAAAADYFITRIRDSAEKLRLAEDCVRLLVTLDQELAKRGGCGETSGVLAIVDSCNIFGASLGDSAAWLFTADGTGELTYGQSPQPLLGSGQAPRPRGFSWPVEEGTLVVASDGLWARAELATIRSRVQTRESPDLALRLAELARISSGAFADDVAIITCRLRIAEPGQASGPDR